MKQEILTPKEKKIRKKIHIRELMETYPGLLTDKENKILSMFTQKNATGANIARKLNISRQAVHDHVRRALTRMENCENKIGNMEKNRKTSIYISKMRKILETAAKETPKQKKALEEALNILKKIEKNI
ncbi:MAG: sigma factor-like helix-turn-helix DNA-binding protein [Caldisericota bacterium]|nr:sigma factor-like helix-turn-helix DNA-binding protein [Caldisericota bacterium]